MVCEVILTQGCRYQAVVLRRIGCRMSHSLTSLVYFYMRLSI